MKKFTYANTLVGLIFLLSGLYEVWETLSEDITRTLVEIVHTLKQVVCIKG